MRFSKIVFALIFSIISQLSLAQTGLVTISGIVKDKNKKTPLPYVSVVLKQSKDSAFVIGTITGEDGLFTLNNIKPGDYYFELSYTGYLKLRKAVFVGRLTDFLDEGVFELEEDSKTLSEVEISAKQDEVNSKMDKKSYSVDDNSSQSGGSVLQAMQNLPGVSVQDGKIQIRGNDKIIILIDGKQTAITGIDGQSGLDNLPASSIERIEIINNPSAKYDANGNAGIINIIYKKEKKDGFNGKVGLAGGLGALWEKKANLPGIRPQYTATPKINPSLSLNYRKNKYNLFFQGDYLFTETLNKNEFVTRTYDDGTIIKQQLKRNRNTGFTTLKAGMDYNLNAYNSFTVSGLFGSEKIIDNGDQPFYNTDYSEQLRLWRFLEDELKTTVIASAAYQHKFKQAGRLLNIGFNYTFHREDEKYFFTNTLPTFEGKDAFKLLSDEHISDLNIDYIKPHKFGRFETGLKFRKRNIPTNMQFFPGLNSPIDSNAGGWATYKELIPALYGTYVYENRKFEAEAGLRVEYVNLKYDVNPNHNTYKSDGYNYAQPFPNIRLAYKINTNNRISLFYNRRVDRPNEVDIRIFPKYDDAEIVKVGNPALKPMFTNSIELSQKTTFKKGYLYTALYHRFADGTITRLSVTVPGSKVIYAIFQNVNKSYNTGVELIFSQTPVKWYTYTLNLNAYRNQIDAFTVVNKYPEVNTFSAAQQEMISGNAKLNNILKLKRQFDLQISLMYLAPDIIPQGKIAARFSLDLGLKKSVKKGKGEWFLNATDLLNTMVIRKDITGQGFTYISTDYYETQVVRLGYSQKF